MRPGEQIPYRLCQEANARLGLVIKVMCMCVQPSQECAVWGGVWSLPKIDLQEKWLVD